MSWSRSGKPKGWRSVLSGQGVHYKVRDLSSPRLMGNKEVKKWSRPRIKIFGRQGGI